MICSLQRPLALAALTAAAALLPAWPARAACDPANLQPGESFVEVPTPEGTQCIEVLADDPPQLNANAQVTSCDLTGVVVGNEVVELATPLGSVCVELFHQQAALTVENFLHYVTSGALVGTFFHRSVPDFIVQGGGFALGASDYEAIPATNGPVPNEPCTLDTPDPLNLAGQICSQRGNERGTLALAKLGGDPNSGTTNWFINLADNRSNLDNQNGGFSVFGKVIGTGMTTSDAIAALPTASQDDLAWMESAFQTSPSFPIPLLQAPLDSSADRGGCWNPALQVTALDDTLLPTLAGLGPDPSNATLPFETLSTFCAAPFANDPATFVGNPTPGLPGGCPFDLLTVATTGPRSLGFVGATPSFWTLSCASQQQALADRAIFFEHEGNRAVRAGKWKLVARGANGPWELYDMDADRTETNDLAAKDPTRAVHLTDLWNQWAKRARVLPLNPRRPQQRAEFSNKTRFELGPKADLPRERAPFVVGRAFSVDATIKKPGTRGVIVAHGGSSHGWTLFVGERHLRFATRVGGKLTTVVSDKPLGDVKTVSARLAKDGGVVLVADGEVIGRGKTPSPLTRMPADGLQVGRDLKGAVGGYKTPSAFNGSVTSVVIELK